MNMFIADCRDQKNSVVQCRAQSYTHTHIKEITHTHTHIYISSWSYNHFKAHHYGIVTTFASSIVKSMINEANMMLKNKNMTIFVKHVKQSIF